MSQIETECSAPRGATETCAPKRASLCRLGPHASVLLAILAIALVWLGAVANILRERTRDEHAAVLHANNLARAFEEQIIGSLRAADQIDPTWQNTPRVASRLGFRGETRMDLTTALASSDTAGHSSDTVGFTLLVRHSVC